MAFDATNTQPRVTAWTTYEELTPDQRKRYGDYVKSCQDVRERAAHGEAHRAKASAAMKAAGGDKQAALALLLGGN